MSLESSKESYKNQNISWWIASIATSVLCCSILFVLFGGYIVEVKHSLIEARESIRTIQENEDRILDEIQMIRRSLLLKTNKLGQEPGTENGAVVDGGTPEVTVPVVPNGAENTPTPLTPVAPAETKAVPAPQPSAPAAVPEAQADKAPAAKK